MLVRLQYKYIILLVSFVFLGLSSCKQGTARFSDKERETLLQDIRQLTASVAEDPDLMEEYLRDDDLRHNMRKYLADFYKNRNYELAWISLDNTEPQAEALMDQIKKAHEHGLDSNSYNISKIRSLHNKVYADTIPEESLTKEFVKLDYTLTAAYLAFASHMLNGVINPEIADSNWVYYKKKESLDDYLQDALKNNNIAQSLESLAPSNPQYGLLKEKLVVFRELSDSQKSPKEIPANISIKPGDSAVVIGTIKKRLIFWGDMDESSGKGDAANVYDKELENAIESFQERHGILEDGKVGPETISMLNASVEKRIDQISLNMERLRWMPEEFGDHYIWVNIPDYQLKILKGGKEDLKMKVIVGEAMNETPVFSDTMEYIVFSPTWTIPESIIKEEMLPKIKKDKNYFKDKNLVLYEDWSPDAEEVDPSDVDWEELDTANINFKIVEQPSDRNALGLVKFMFPNSEAIYLHDTPTNHLFDRTERGFSHGCIRVEKPKELAQYLLNENEEKWDLKKITEHMELDTPATVTLKEKLPVHIVYQSAWVDEESKIHFRKDIYNHDKAQGKAIEKKEEIST